MDVASYSTALITGASSGFGEAIARRWAQQGKRLILLARREERLNALVDELSKQASCHAIVCDIRDKDRLKHQLENLPEAFQSVDILVNNAGLALGLEPAAEASWLDWEQMIETNCMSLAWMTRFILPGMLARQRGHIINMGSIAGYYAYKGANVYGATKAFVEQFSQNLRADVLGSPIRVTHIAPGLAGGSEFSLVRFKGDQKKADQVYTGVQPLLPESVAEAVVWAVNQPAFVNICTIELMPTCQAVSGVMVNRA
jgi:3-hydroxy acid dehydrogenase / malonic semialdehyde reductase